MKTEPIIAAIATARGRAGIGIVRVSGPNLAEFCVRITGREPVPRRAMRVDFLGARGEVLDYGIALYFPAPHSYTGEDVLELQGHGGEVVMQLLLRRCLELGARLAEPGEFTKRAFLNNKLDLAQAESVADLIDASTAQAARCALRSLQGVFSERIAELRQRIVDLRVLVEAGIDFPDEEVESLTVEQACARLQGLRRQIDSVREAARQGSLLREGMQVALVGRPNVGKSSILNSLSGEDLAIVTDIPGTTRDAIRQTISLEGVPAHIIDTAGLRDPVDLVEKLGIARTWSIVEKADLALVVVDATVGESAEDEAIIARLPDSVGRVRVMNKIDLLGEAPRLERRGSEQVVWLSAKTGEGIPLLRAALLEAAGWRGEAEGLFLARERHLEALRRAALHLEQAESVVHQAEFFAEELRLAQVALGAITGEFTTEDLLGQIFSRFCIGK